MNKIGALSLNHWKSKPSFRYATLRFDSQLFISRLSYYTTSEELTSMFSPFGVVKEARLVMDPRTKRHKGFGFVTFETQAQAQNALKAINGSTVRGRLIMVEFAQSQNTGASSN